jgi:hypothetical protein
MSSHIAGQALSAHAGSACAFAVTRYLKAYARTCRAAVVVTTHRTAQASTLGGLAWSEQPHCQLALQLKDDADTISTLTITKSSISLLVSLAKVSCTCELTAVGMHAVP